MADRNTEYDELEVLFAQARRGRGRMPDALARRMLADAGRVQDAAARAEPAPPPARAGLWEQFRAALGGWPALGGLVAAGVAGIWIGLAPPAFLPDVGRIVIEREQDIDLIDIDGLVAALAEDG